MPSIRKILLVVWNILYFSISLGMTISIYDHRCVSLLHLDIRYIVIHLLYTYLHARIWVSTILAVSQNWGSHPKSMIDVIDFHKSYSHVDTSISLNPKNTAWKTHITMERSTIYHFSWANQVLLWHSYVSLPEVTSEPPLENQDHHGKSPSKTLENSHHHGKSPFIVDFSIESSDFSIDPAFFSVVNPRVLPGPETVAGHRALPRCVPEISRFQAPRGVDDWLYHVKHN